LRGSGEPFVCRDLLQPLSHRHLRPSQRRSASTQAFTGSTTRATYAAQVRAQPCRGKSASR
jgi:hypothetical protein